MSILEPLPRLLRQQLEEQSKTFPAEDRWIFAAHTDLNLDGEYADGYVILGQDVIVCARARGKKIGAQYYKGTRTLQEKRQQEDQVYTIQMIPIGQIETLEVIKQIGCSMLVCRYTQQAEALQEDDAGGKGSDREGQPVEALTKESQLAYVTNMETGNLRHLANLFSKVKKGETLTQKDLKPETEEEYCPQCGQMYPDPNRKVCPKCLDKKSVFFRTLSYFLPYKGKMAGIVLCIMATSVLNLVWPYLNGTILYDKVLAQDEKFMAFLHLPAGKGVTALTLVVLTMILTKISMQTVGIIQGVLTAKIVPGVVRSLKNDVFESMSKLSIKFYNSKQTGGLMTRVMDDADEISGFFIDGLPYMLSNIFILIATAVILLRMNWRLAIPVLMYIPIVFWISGHMVPKFWNLHASRHRAKRSLNSKVNDNLTGARVVKAFGQEKKEIVHFDRYNVRLMKTEVELVRFDNLFGVLYTAAENISNLIVWGLGGFFMFYYGNISLGVLITFISYVMQLSNPLDLLSFGFRWWAESMNGAQRIFEIVDSVPDLTEADNPVHLEHMKGEIELRHVTFAYDPNKTILKDVSLKIESGRMLGIVGRSGAGKTTLVNLISRLYDPQQGEIYLDGINVKDIAFSDLRRNVAMVSQETYIFMGSVLDNIAYANPKATREEVVQAAVLASAHDFICKMPDGYDTIVGSRGRDLSGGEKQRISIARAILANPKILILDEATASVDTETEKAIQASINYLIQGRTTISIAHRLSTLRDADQLVVMEEGRITEEGTSQELMEKKGTYYKLRELQTRALALQGLE